MANYFVTKYLVIQYTNIVVITQTCVGECGLGEWHHEVTSERVGATSPYIQLPSIHALYMYMHAYS